MKKPALTTDQWIEVVKIVATVLTVLVGWRMLLLEQTKRYDPLTAQIHAARLSAYCELNYDIQKLERALAHKDMHTTRRLFLSFRDSYDKHVLLVDKPVMGALDEFCRQFEMVLDCMLVRGVSQQGLDLDEVKSAAGEVQYQMWKSLGVQPLSRDIPVLSGPEW